MTKPYPTLIEHPDGKSSYSIEQIREMFASRKLSGLRGFITRLAQDRSDCFPPR
jgi:hypothetical protein